MIIPKFEAQKEWTTPSECPDLSKYSEIAVDLETRDLSFRIPIRGFIFKNGLMQEHFNENYLESDTYPNASFTGSIEGWKDITLTEKLQPVSLKGTMTIHGVSKDIAESGNILMKENRVIGAATFKITVADYKVEIPKIIRDNIAKVVDVTVDLSLKKK